jgi:TPR repeat protein
MDVWGNWRLNFQLSLMGLFDIFKKAKKDSLQGNQQSPRLHHYQFAYRALPGLAFADAFVPLGFGHDTPKGSLVKFWKHVGSQFAENERVSDASLLAHDAPFGTDYVILLITMPAPLRATEAYFVAIIYPKSWFNDADQENKEPDLRYFILEKSDVPGAGGISGGTLRILTKTGHGAVKFGIPVSADVFLKEIHIALLNPLKWVTWVESEPWNFTMQDSENVQIINARNNKNPEAIYECGLKHYHELKDYAEAMLCFKEAAALNLAKAQFMLGSLYRWGHGVTKNEAEAFKWYLKAAEQGEPTDQIVVGECYEKGLGVQMDATEAVKWYRKAAEQGDQLGQTVLGGCYLNGLGVQIDATEAVKWYRKAANQGNGGGYVHLGKCYKMGLGVPKDYSEAYKFYKLASGSGKKSLVELTEKMSLAEVEEGERRFEAYLRSLN